MLQYERVFGGDKVWVNPRLVLAIQTDDGKTVVCFAGFAVYVTEEAHVVAAEISAKVYHATGRD